VTGTERPPVGPIERTAWGTVAALTGLLGVAGFVNSFARVEAAMRPYFGPRLAWTVPLAVDVGILVFTALDLLMAYRDLRTWWLRYVPRGLVAVTVYLNAVGEDRTEGRVAHAVLPLMWVVAVEVAGTAVRSIFGLRSTRPSMDRVRRSRWVLAPVSTARLRRRMILREETDLEAARVRDLAFELAKADLADTHGPVVWRWKAPRRQRLLLRRGEIAPVSLPALALAPATDGTTGTGPVETAPGPVPDRPRTGAGTTLRRPVGTSRGSGPGPVDLMAVAGRVADRLETDGVALARRPFIAAMRAEGHPIGTSKAGALIAQLKQRRNGHHDLLLED
jgi:hypothetical protein